MRRALTAVSVVLAAASAVTLYAVSYDTRRIASRVHTLERAVDRAESDIAAARAELAHLSRPQRIEPMARALGMAPPRAGQMVDESRLPHRPFSAP